MQRYTVKQLAKLSGVSIRTLHYYDEMGLLKPARVGNNRYRYYEDPEVLRLQQILFHRELGFSLQEIAELLDRPDFDRLATLRSHRARLEREAQRYADLVRTIDRTIADINGKRTMQHTELFKGFSPEKQTAYEQWLIERYGNDMRERIDVSRRKLDSLTDAEKARLLEELAQIEHDLAEACRRQLPSGSAALDGALTRHRDWVGVMWNRACPPDAYAGLADLYLSHADFRARYEALAPGFTEYLAAAMKAHAARVETAR
jgi:DNA-binding transcriptional MerR regulator